MGCKTTVTKAELEALVSYDPITGDLLWKERTAEQIPDDNLRKGWNTQWAGGKAGHLESKEGHVRIRICGRLLYARRAIYILMTGENPPGQLILKDGNAENLKWTNIHVKETKKAAEKRRARRLAARDTAPKPVYEGVVYSRGGKVWYSIINLSKLVSIRVGTFATDKEAIKARADRIESMGIAC